ncbi:hypothetical protein FBEOM_9549 [Fusarium beomiforme]|uniref:Fucose-specific lectin n=1 Tax=Fusarium beomiforme TaxID=44412 RepID=A0A9P5DV34_9HYPO|nr:hypothetical protein FBEOM_9549 [Fusarium beomiforme]
MQVPSPEPDLILPLLFICLVLVCILVTSCLILVIVVIRLTIHTQRSLPVEVKEKKQEAKEKQDAKEKLKDKVQEEVKKTIKKLGDPVQDFLHSAQDHLKHPKNPFTQHPISEYFHSDHSSTEMSHIQHMTAVAQPDGNTILFQVNEQYELIFYESQTPSEKIPRKKYDLNTLTVNGSPIKVNKNLPVIAAVAFTHPDSCGGKPQVRVYYVHRDELSLREVYRVGGHDDEWKDGMDFNDKSFTISQISGLTANVFQPPSEKKNFIVKVYYQRDNADSYADVVYNIVGVSDEWGTRPNVTKA